MSRHDVRGTRFLIVLLFALACSQKGQVASEKSPSTVAAARTLLGGLAGLGQGLDALLADHAAFDLFVTGVVTGTPPQTGIQSKVSVDKATCKHGGKVTLTVQSFATAGVYQYADLTIGGSAPGHGYLVSRVENDDDCAPVGIAIPPMTGAGPGVAYVFIALKNGGNPNAPDDYQVRVIDAATYTDVAHSPVKFSVCAEDPMHQWFGDHSQAKSWKEICDHKPPKFTIAGKIVPAGDITDDWSLWFSCGSNCCFADTGGSKNPRDSTGTDSTHGDTSHKAAPPKKP